MDLLSTQLLPKACRTQRLIVVLEQSSLETVKLGKGKEGHFQLLNSDDHSHILKKHNRDSATARPDIAHQCLLALLDSPLSKAGHLQVFVKTTKNALIQVNPHVRIPRTFKRFCGLMVQLLHKLSIRAVNGNEKLLKIVKNPITDHLPPDCFKITMSSEVKPTRLSEYLPTLPKVLNLNKRIDHWCSLLERWLMATMIGKTELLMTKYLFPITRFLQL
jgi:rRNA small subunit pseudouridine methyltransferase Nep1